MNEREGVALSQWALSQMNYLMGDNPLSRSYVVGFTVNSDDHFARFPHHRAAHGSDTNSMLVPAEHRHVLWGALVGGPDLDDEHKDETTDYVDNEVAIDDNAGFVGALAGLFEYFDDGQSVEPWEPAPEPEVDAYVVRAKLEQESSSRTQVTLEISNRSVHPPAEVDDLSLRYFFDISDGRSGGMDRCDRRRRHGVGRPDRLRHRPRGRSADLHGPVNPGRPEAG